MSVPAAAPVLRIEGLSKRFNSERPLIDELHLTIGRGERVALLGESGCGKSTLLNLIAGLEQPDAGRVTIDGEPVLADSPDAAALLRRRLLGFVFQAFHLLPHLDVAQNVAVPLLLLGWPLARAQQRVAELLGRVGLGDRGGAMPRELSGGEIQRVALVRAIAHRPALVLADEPTGNLDPATATRALALLASETEAAGGALLLVTHSEQAAAIAERRLRLAGGHLVSVA